MARNRVIDNFHLDKIKDYYDKGWTLEKITKKTGFNYNLICNYLYKFGIADRKKERVKKNTELVLQIKELLGKELKPPQIYKQLGITRGLYYYLMKKYNKVKIQDEE